MEIICSGIPELDVVAARSIEFGKEYNIWLLKGEIGSGKTTFIHTLAKYLEVVDNVNSPSFSIINEYLTKDGRTLYHFDFYRVRSVEEILEIGFFEYIDSGNLCIIEWPEKIENLISSPYIEISIQITGRNTRIFNLITHV